MTFFFHFSKKVGFDIKSYFLGKIKTLNYDTPPLSCRRQITHQNLTKFTNWKSQTRSPQYQCTYQVWWKSINVYSKYHLETKNGRTYYWWMNGQIDWHMDVQHETIIPRHYRVVGYNNKNISKCLLKVLSCMLNIKHRYKSLIYCYFKLLKAFSNFIADTVLC